MFAIDDTIVAIATPPGRGGIGVVRLSGPVAVEIAASLIDRRTALEPRVATFARVAAAPDDGDASTGAGAGETGQAGGTVFIDQVVVTYFPGPASYTGEHVVEIAGHGSPVLLHLIVRAAIAAGARLAQPGEFTLRAFLHGRIDLVQAEAIADLVEAATPLQARLAFDQLEGTLTKAIVGIERSVFDLAARLEASIDFPDEGYRFIDPPEAAREIAAIAERVAAWLSEAERGRIIREGRHAVVTGRPNVGKSSVFNILAGTDRAIVTEHAGTTRDLVTERVAIRGVPFTIVDTAGVRVATSDVEQEGVLRARAALKSADVAILVLDQSVPLAAADHELLAETTGAPRVVVANKCDLAAAWCATDLQCSAIVMSARTGEGAGELGRAIVKAVASREDLRDTPALANVRHIELLRRTQEALRSAQNAAAQGLPEELVLVDLRASRDSLEEIIGRRTNEDVLRHIFERFCIGK